MTARPTVPVPELVRVLIWRLIDGWRPTRLEPGRLESVRWGSEDITARIGQTKIDIPHVLVEVPGLAFEDTDHLWNVPLKGAFSDGSVLDAELSCPSGDHAKSRYWSIESKSRRACLWVGRIHGKLSDAQRPFEGNLSTREIVETGDGQQSGRLDHSHLRLQGRHTYYLVRASTKTLEWFLIVDTHDRAPPSREDLYPDFLALQFVLGRGLKLEAFFGVDEAGATVGMVGGVSIGGILNPDARSRGYQGRRIAASPARGYPHDAVASRKPNWPGRTRTSVSARTRTAYHEAGHAVLSAAINDTPRHVSIRPSGGTLGRTAQWMSVRPTSLAQVYLAGFAAEHLLTGRRPRQYDLEVGMAILATTDPTLVEVFEGVETSDGHGVVEQVLRLGVRDIAEEIRREVDRLYEITRESLSSVWLAVEAMAKAVLQQEELDREAILGVLGDFDLFNRVLVVQNKHGLLLDSAGGAQVRLRLGDGCTS